MKIQQVAEELGVRHVLDGSVQKTDNRVRISVRLIDAITGRHLWAESYDREPEKKLTGLPEGAAPDLPPLAIRLQLKKRARHKADAAGPEPDADSGTDGK